MTNNSNNEENVEFIEILIKQGYFKDSPNFIMGSDSDSEIEYNTSLHNDNDDDNINLLTNLMNSSNDIDDNNNYININEDNIIDDNDDNNEDFILDKESIKLIFDEFNKYSFLRPMKSKLKSCLKKLKFDINNEANGNSYSKIIKSKLIHSKKKVIETPLVYQHINIVDNNARPATFAVGDIVEVAARCWPGSNKQGGAARIINNVEIDVDGK
jgi:hypothetical protein